jgi:DNA helicase-2/ATP-dependent DNA helicase PcrA
MSELTDILNLEQRDAVLNGDGPVIVAAGAGSGKTRVLTSRIAYLIAEKGVRPYNILAITFTNRAAAEMRERILGMCSDTAGLWMCTFHSMCVKILRADIDKLGYDKNFSIYSDIESERVIKNILKRDGIDLSLKGAIMNEISRAKEQALSPVQYAELKQGMRGSYAEIYQEYEDELKRSNALDFDDLLLKTLELFLKTSNNLDQYSNVLRKYQERFHYIHIDEFQDTNKLQYTLIKLLGFLYKNIFAVGDEDQSIYGWRGADITNFKDLQKDFPGTRIFKLEQNYRSTGNILKCANNLIAHNSDRIEKKLWTGKSDGPEVIYKRLSGDREEAAFVISGIAADVKSGCHFSDFAILVRANSLTRQFEESLNLYGYPYKIYGGFKFYERKEIKDIISYLRIIGNPKDNEAILRIINFPKRGIGDRAVEQMVEYADRTGMPLIDVILGIINNSELPNAIVNKLAIFREVLIKLIRAGMEMKLWDIIDYVLETVNIESAYNKEDSDDRNRLENIEELVGAIKQFGRDNPEATVTDYLQSVSLMSDTDDIGNGEYITIATVHSAKGLEFPVVYIVALEEGIFPSSQCVNEPSQMEEERRVMYVASTRAKQKLIITSAGTRFRFSSVETMMPSRFLREMGIDSEPKDIKNYNRAQAANSSSYGGGYSSSRRYTERYDNYDNYSIEPSSRPVTLPVYKPSSPVSDANKDLSGYKKGAKVEHRRFGEGTVVEMKEAHVAIIAFKGLGNKEFDLTIAPLKVIGE